MTYEVHEIPATKPRMARLEAADEPDAWIATDAALFEEIEP